MRCLYLMIYLYASAALFASESVLVFSAASMTDVMNELAREYEQDTGIKIIVSAGGSGTLARQIEQGAPAAVVVLADETWMNYLQQRSLIVASSRTVIASNRLVLITPKNMPVTLASEGSQLPLSEQFSGRFALADPDSVPAGAYARQALQHFGWWDGLAGRLAPTADVRAALRLVERGECHLGMVYASDALESTTVSTVMTMPVTAHNAIHYPAAVTAHAAEDGKAMAFLQRLATAKTAAVFNRFGFSALPKQ